MQRIVGGLFSGQSIRLHHFYRLLSDAMLDVGLCQGFYEYMVCFCNAHRYHWAIPF